MHKLFMMIGAAAAAIGAFADSKTLTWNGADGAAWEGENWLDGGTPSAWIDGANAVFPSAATVTLNGAVTVSNITAAGALTVTGTVACVHSGFLNPNSPVLVFPGLTMDDIDGMPIAADLNGNYVSPNYYYSRAHFWRRSGTTATAQFQCTHNGHLRCVKATFTEGAGGIYAMASDNASYFVRKANGGTSALGRDIDAIDNVEAGDLATIADGNGIGVCNIRRYAAELNVAGTASFGANTVTFDKAVLKVTAPVAQTFGSEIVCTEGRVVVMSSAAAANVTYGNTASGSGATAVWLTATASDTVLANIALSKAEPVSAVMAGGSMGSTPNADPYHVKFNGETMTLQFQFAGGSYIKGVKVELKQSGPDVTVRAIESYYHPGGTLGEDLENASGVQKDTVTANGVKNMTLRQTTVPTVTFNAENEISYMTVDNASARFAASGSQPRIDLLARNAAHVEYKAQENNLHADATRIFESGSAMVPLSNMSTVSGAKYVFDASTLYTPQRHGSVYDGNTYFNNLTVRNGASVPGNPLRCGATETMTYTSEGDAGSELAAGIDLVKINTAGVTNDLFIVTKADLLLSGNVYDWPLGGNFVGVRVCKQGAATLTLSGSNTFAGRLTVEEGTLALGSDTALPASAPLTLAGGTVACGSFANATGALTLSGDATINLGDGALSFADSSGETWAPDATLNIVGPDKLPVRSLRFGTDDSGLTRAQLKRISYNGGRVSLDEDGYLGGPKGLIISVF